RTPRAPVPRRTIPRGPPRRGPPRWRARPRPRGRGPHTHGRPRVRRPPENRGRRSSSRARPPGDRPRPPRVPRLRPSTSFLHVDELDVAELRKAPNVPAGDPETGPLVHRDRAQVQRGDGEAD